MYAKQHTPVTSHINILHVKKSVFASV